MLKQRQKDKPVVTHCKDVVDALIIMLVEMREASLIAEASAQGNKILN